MTRRRYRSLFAPLAVAALLILTITIPYSLSARQRSPVADFAAPMSPQVARMRVQEAQQADAARRDALARSLGATSAAALPLVQNMFFTQSSHHVSNRAGFLEFWREHGGQLIFGYPISEEIVEDGRIVQYFERARFEYHPEYFGQEGQ